ncbi:hypothetical protein ACFE04_010187 [Oxalis oulophora]
MSSSLEPPISQIIKLMKNKIFELSQLQLVGCIDLDILPLSGLALNQWENSTVSLKKTNKNQQKLKTPIEKGATKKIESLLLDVLKSTLESISIKELEKNEESFIGKYSADDEVFKSD